ncbi:NAD-dependent epimerase/dehydratase family protein [Pengzhenrongella frigida]|uniref:NAD(P)-dependent oxidoreductase n=1 Tax=Pengzhenrongella frigida TaxID=1259133 RepID=A0A4Q5N297_9MICO|nr:NAD(P)-dependent oxidoreductase [Cellulomonas sp. HLT2-17]RYV51343.1 NAD(P)-dependent oxidoreductase [Cellulomonas sp. HLT2-17]
MTEIVLVGASGWFGKQLLDHAPNLVAVPARDVLASRGEILRPLLAGRNRMVVNVAGARVGNHDTMQRLNVDLPRLLAEQVVNTGGHLVHLGSAAEYGTNQPDGICREESVPAPESDYGRSKLTGTTLVLEAGSASVLRVFNVAANPPQQGSPLAEISNKLALASKSGTDVELWSAGTVRDWVRPDFVIASILYAAKHRPIGLFNICSGIGVRMGESVELAIAILDSPIRVKDLRGSPPTVVIGAPERWLAASQLCEQVTPSDLAKLMCGQSGSANSVEGEHK